MIIKNKDWLCWVYSILVSLQPPKHNPKAVSINAKNRYEIKTNKNDLTNGLKVDDFEKFEQLNNLKKNAFELNEDKSPTQLYVSENLNKQTIE